MKSPVTKSWMRSILYLEPAPPPAPKRCVLFMVSSGCPAAALGAVTQSLWRCRQVGGRAASRRLATTRRRRASGAEH
jgi:hypothetical protein